MEELEARARRARRRTLLVAVAGLVAGAALGWSLPHHGTTARAIQIVGWTITVAGLSGTFSVVWTTTALAAHVRFPLRSLTREASRFLQKSVYTGQPIVPPESELARRAFDYARVVRVYGPLEVTQFFLLFAGLGGLQLARLSDDGGFVTVLSRATSGLLVIAAVVVTLVWRRRLAGTRRYLRTVVESALPR